MKQSVSTQAKQSRSALKRSLLITAVYAFVGYAWIIGSELVVSSMLPESPQIFVISIIKGLGFVTATAALIFFLVYSSLRKITRESDKRRRNEVALEEAQRIAHIGNFSYDASLQQFQFSDEAIRVMGLDAAALPTKPEEILKLIHAEDRERVYVLAKDALTRGESTSFECRILHADESERYIQVRLQLLDKNQSEHPTTIGTLQDITDRVCAQMSAKTNEAIYKTFLNSSYDLVYLKDSSLHYISVNTNMQEYYGIKEEELIGRQLSDIKPSEEAKLWEARDKSVLLSGKPLFIEDTSEGQSFETIIFPVGFADNKRGVGGISRDISQRKQTEAIVIQERDRAQTYFEIAPIIFIVLNNEGCVAMINRCGCETLGLPKEEIIGTTWVEHFVPENDREGVNDVIKQIYEGTFVTTEIHENGMLTADNDIRTIEWRNTILRDAEGNPTGILSAGVDVTNLRNTIGALRESERSKSVLLSNLPGMAYRCNNDHDWTMKFVSSGCYELTGFLPDEFIDNRVVAFNDIICPEYQETIWEESQKHLIAHEGVQYEYEILTASGERKWVLDINQGVADESGKIVALEGIIVDITKSKLQFLQIQYLSNHDQLTGLHNRLHYDNAKKRLDKESSLPLSMIFVDINGLKLINDAFGYDAGDRMIQTTAALIKANILPHEIVARIGGDEFGLLLPYTDKNECAKRMQSLKEVFDNYNAILQDKTMIINISIGCETKSTMDEDLSHVARDAEANLSQHKLLDQKSHHNAVLSSMMATLFARSFETEEHAKRIGDLCATVGMKLNLSHDDIDRLRLFAYLHDIGKIGISDQILNKPGPLNEEELVVMRTHPEIGYRIAMSSPDFASIADLILTHHERWDGTGYPNHLSGENIPILARILAVADAYDAMTEDRVYRKALSAKAAMDEIRKNAGTQFDPRIAQVFLEIVEQDDL